MIIIIETPALPELESKFEYTFKYASNGAGLLE